MLDYFWSGIGDLKPGQAVLVTGFIGFFTLAAGHSFAAWLANNRDERIDKKLRDRIYIALLAECESFLMQLSNCNPTEQYSDVQIASVPNASSYTIIRGEIMKHMHLLDIRDIVHITQLYASLDTYDAEIDNFGFERIGAKWVAYDLDEDEIDVIGDVVSACDECEKKVTECLEEIWSNSMKDIAIRVTNRNQIRTIKDKSIFYG